MTTKEWLNRGFLKWRRLEIKRAHLETLGNIVSRYEAREVETYHAENSNESTMLTWSELKREVDTLAADLAQIDAQTDEAISRLANPTEYAVLYNRYIRRQRWQDVAETLHYSLTYVYQVHAAAVSHVGEVAYDLID